MSKITVMGSFVVDLMSKTPHLPKRGETVFGGPFKLGPGGKGSNQGVAAKRAGADVTMITKLGKDEFSEIALKSFVAEGIDTAFVYQNENFGTGAALIMVEENTGENSIVVSVGACNHVTREEIERAEEKIKDSTVFLTQLETNIDAVEHGINLAKKHGVTVVLNPAPVQPFNEELFKKVDIITPNEVEASILSGTQVVDISSAREAAEYFLNKGVGTVVITLGGLGAFVKTKDFEKHIPAFKVEQVVDTTGAGDAFNGGFVTALSENQSLEDAVIFANAVGALSVTKEGTAPAMPYRQEIEDFLKRKRSQQ